MEEDKIEGHKWYAIQTYAGSEQAVKRAIIEIVKNNNIEEKLKEIIVPTEDVIEVKNGKKKLLKEVSILDMLLHILI